MRFCVAVISWAMIAGSLQPICGQNRSALTTSMELDGSLATIAAVKTYKSALAQVNILDGDGRPLLQSPMWETKPGVSYGAQLTGVLPGKGTSKYQVEFVITVPKGDPGSAEALTTQSRNPAKGVTNLVRQVQDAFFKPNPASPPKGGDFLFNLGAPAGVYMEIWEGAPMRGHLRYFNRIRSVLSAMPIHWDLKDSNKQLVPIGNYAAILKYQASNLPGISRLVRFVVTNP